MNLEYSDADQAFREEVQNFLRDNTPSTIRTKIDARQKLTKEDYMAWHKILYGRGWVAPNWPVEFGGTGWTPLQCHIFDEEIGLSGSPRVLPFGVNMVGPVIMEFGNDTQKAHYLPRILSCEDVWCQGYSEPGSGSDLASLKTRATRDGDEYVVNGSKIWTTSAHWADMIFCLVRTDTNAKNQEGISFLLINMHESGIDVRPIITMDGGHEVNQVFFEDVRVPITNLVGEENKGWTYAKFLLKHERAGIAAIGSQKRQLNRLKEIARAEQSNGQALIEEPRFRDKISRAEIELMALEYTELRAVSAANQGRVPGTEVNLLKIRGSEMQQKISELLIEAIGYYANPFVPDSFDAGWNEEPIGPDYAAALAPEYFNWRKSSIYAGSNEIQKNIISKMVLGL
ncbi:MAG: Cyclohexane-1-carbonyl-CoA dehydrogenase [Alphaproteobacteria bacterium MarineAlpha9_Bin7]|nr:MAG: Cyclohexane-1-carbonyl-CoA dehydrogenase [Alphaproteobacteria bacterium MarineAlpha9_Bin7]